ncbi:hypothetical protein D3C76_1450860 [compost metagenome]
MAQSDRSGGTFDLMALFNDAFLIPRRQIRLQHVQIARHHLFEYGYTVRDQLRTHQLDVLLQHFDIQQRLRFSRIYRRHGAFLFVTGVPELLNHGS